jgi:hypothetical protein
LLIDILLAAWALDAHLVREELHFGPAVRAEAGAHFQVSAILTWTAHIGHGRLPPVILEGANTISPVEKSAKQLYDDNITHH